MSRPGSGLARSHGSALKPQGSDSVAGSRHAGRAAVAWRGVVQAAAPKNNPSLTFKHSSESNATASQPNTTPAVFPDFTHGSTTSPPKCSNFTKNAGDVSVPKNVSVFRAASAAAKARSLQARKVATFWALGVEARSKSKEGVQQRKARFRRHYLCELLKVTTIQGFINFSFEDRHISEHVVWAVAMVVACVGSVMLCLFTWDHYQTSPVVQSLERSYTNWKYQLPSVFACPLVKWSGSLVTEVANRLAEETGASDIQKLKKFLQALADSTSYETLGVLNEFAKNSSGLPMENWLDLAISVRYNFSSNPITSQHITETLTEVGFCGAINSVIAYATAINITERDMDPPSPEIVSSFSEIAQISRKYFTSPFSLYVQGVAGLPNPAYWTVRVANELLEADVDVEVGEIYATSRLDELSVKQRRCRFEEEVPRGSPRPVYSRDVCLEMCRARLARRLCGCRPFFVNVSNIPQCGFKGIACLSRYTEELIWLRNITTQKRVECDCYPACNMYSYTFLERKVKMSQLKFGSPGFSVNSIVFLKTRIKRDVVFSIIDLAVSFGGAIGLFLGVSVLSVLEVVYYFTLRLFFHPQRRNFL